MRKLSAIIYSALKALGLIRLIKSLIRGLGFSVLSSNGAIGVFDFVNMVQSRGIRIDVVYDIGANRGQWTRDLRNSCDKDIVCYLFEPNRFHNQSLKATGSPYFNVLFSDVTEEVEFYSINGTGDSIFREVSKLYDEVKPIKMKTEVLEDFVMQNKLPRPDLIKLDTQGSELKILHGAMKLLGTVKFLVLECSIMEFNSGAPTISEVTSFLKGQGFSPYAISEIHKDENVLFQMDIIFVADWVISSLT